MGLKVRRRGYRVIQIRNVVRRIAVKVIHIPRSYRTNIGKSTAIPRCSRQSNRAGIESGHREGACVSTGQYATGIGCCSTVATRCKPRWADSRKIEVGAGSWQVVSNHHHSANWDVIRTRSNIGCQSKNCTLSRKRISCWARLGFSDCQIARTAHVTRSGCIRSTRGGGSHVEAADHCASDLENNRPSITIDTRWYCAIDSASVQDTTSR